MATLLLFLAGCRPAPESIAPAASPTQAPAPPTATPAPRSDEEALRLLLLAEGEAVVGQDIDRLMSLWTRDGRVVDAGHTPHDPGDDLTWNGWYAIRDRYITLVFPGNPDTAAPADLEISIEGDRATVTATTRIGDEVSPAGDRWTFVRTPEGWRIESLTYNLEPE